MLNESRRRAYLTAMQVVNWLPRTELPFAAPSRPQLLVPLPPPVEVQRVAPAASPAEHAAPAETSNVEPVARQPERPRVEVPRPSLASTRTATPAAEEAEPAPPKAPVVPPPRFALQLLRAGRCLLLVELTTGQPFQSRDPSYLLLKDMLRAAGLPDSPQIIGEPVRWPLLVRGQMDQGPEAARDFVQGFVGARLEDEPCACLWLIGLPSMKYAGEADAESYHRELQIEGLGKAWALPGLELLMDEPERKADVWKAMRRLMTRWKSIDE
ncbi:energy transducer TonB [Pseudomonas viridiflava]|uniref:energy transducer TonB n=1 Tax=Pseudomonas viridiflava TaxID=33069 RepID=UPI0010FA6BE2|nr:energy transducer TonB [Pseudomonas viridiflava]